MPLPGSPVVTDALPAEDARQGRSFAARHGAALAAGATALVLLALAAALVPRRPLEAPPAPPAHWFDDRAGLVSPGYAGAKSEYLQQYLPLFLHTSILIVTEPNVPSGAIEDYTARAANAWRIGAKGADNGMVLFVFPNQRTIRLEVGYGLEGPLPDVEAKHLVDDTLLPKFTAGHYEEGFDDFIFGVEKKLKVYAGETGRTPNATGIVEYVFAVLRQTPRAAGSTWTAFQEADMTGRAFLALCGAVLASLLGYALAGLVEGLVALIQLPWRIATGNAVHALSRARLAAEFAPAEFIRRPPRSLVAIATELRLTTIAWGLMCVAGLVVGVAFVGMGTEVFIGERGQFSGAGITTSWPAR
jgi:uncharacterized membrane protein YgcG